MIRYKFIPSKLRFFDKAVLWMANGFCSCKQIDSFVRNSIHNHNYHINRFSFHLSLQNFSSQVSIHWKKKTKTFNKATKIKSNENGN